MKEGDSLQSLAIQYYGNEDFWFVIAEANGLGEEAGGELVAGQTLTIPQYANSQNSFDNFLPQNLAELIGDTTPALPYIPPPSEAGCNPIASLIMVVVAVAVTAMTGGAAAGFVGKFAGYAICLLYTSPSPRDA